MDIDSPTTRSQEKIERFFKLPMNASQVLKRIVEDLREKDANVPFVEKFIEQQGYPIWEKAEIRLPLTQKGINKEQANQATGTDTIIVIPTVLLNEEFVKSLFCAKMDVNILYKLIEGERYAEFGFDHDPNRAEPNADDIVAQFIKFEQINFNDTLFLIKDNRLFDNWPVGTIKPVSFLLKIKIQHTTNNDFPTNGESCTLYYDVGAGYWLFGQCNLGGGSGGQTGNGNGNVGTIGWNPMPTGGGNGTPTGTPPPPISLCERGWYRYVPGANCPGSPFPPPPPNYNMYYADSVIIDTSITNNYPCFQNIIDTLSIFGNLNRTSQVALATIFGVYKYIHVTFKLDPTLAGTNVNAVTDLPHTVPVPTIDTFNFYDTIRLNPDLFTYGTKEYLAATVVHEAMHAYIDYQFKRYALGYIDSFVVKNQFPIFWGYLGLANASTAYQQHFLMANNWVTTIAHSLTAFSISPGQSIPMRDSIYRSLAWGGLHETDIFRTNTGKCNILAINAAARDRNILQPFPFSVPEFPSCNGVYDFDSQHLMLHEPCQ